MKTSCTDSIISNTAVVRRLIEEVFNRGNLDVANELLHKDYRYESPRETMVGIEEFKAFVTALRTAFPDMRLEIIDTIGNTNAVSTRCRLTGTHLGEFFGLPASGNRIEVDAVVMSHLIDRKIIREWELLDDLALQRQLGA